MMSRRCGDTMFRFPHWLAACALVAGCQSHSPAMPDGATTPDDGTAVDAPAPTLITIKTFAPFTARTGPTQNASLLAFQDGDGPWVAIAGNAGVYHAATTTGRYAVAVGCAGTVNLYYQSVTDTTEVHTDGCFKPTDTVHVSLTLLGLATDQTGEVWFGAAPQFVISGDPISVELAKGSVDVFVRVFADNDADVPVLLFRGPTMNLQTDQTLSLDLRTMGTGTQTRALTLTNRSPEDSVTVRTSHATPRSQTQWPVWGKEFGTTAPDSYLTLPDAALQPDDVSNISVVASHATADGREIFRFARSAMKSPGALTLALPAEYTPSAPTLDRAAVPRVTVTIPLVPSTLQTSSYYVPLTARGQPGTNGVVPLRFCNLRVLPGWAGTQSAAIIVTPDLSSLPGWSPDMALFPGASVNWSILRNDSNMPYETASVDGRQMLETGVSGTVSP